MEIATNGYGALEKFRKEQFDLVITDQAMPGLTGLQLAEAIKKEANTPILMLTGCGIDPLEVGVRKVVDAIGGKPISQRELRNAMARAIQRPQSVGTFEPSQSRRPPGSRSSCRARAEPDAVLRPNRMPSLSPGLDTMLASDPHTILIT